MTQERVGPKGPTLSLSLLVTTFGYSKKFWNSSAFQFSLDSLKNKAYTEAMKTLIKVLVAFAAAYAALVLLPFWAKLAIVTGLITKAMK